MSKRKALFAGILAGCFAAFSVCSCTNATAQNFIFSGAVGFQFNPACAFDSISKRSMVVYEHSKYQPPNKHSGFIFGDYVEGNGAPSLVGPPSRRVQIAIGHVNAPDVASRSVNTGPRFLVVYDGIDKGERGSRDIYAQFLDHEGELWYGDKTVALGDEGKFLIDAKVAYNDDRDEFLVVWLQVERIKGRLLRTSLYGRRLSADGNFVDAKAFAIESGEYIVGSADVAYGDGKYFVVYSRQQFDWSAELSFLGQMIPGAWNTGKLPPAFTIHDAGSSPSVAYHEHKKEFLVAWEGMLHKDWGNILVHKIRPDQTFVWPAASKIPPPSLKNLYSLSSPALAYNPNSRMFVIAYEVEMDNRNIDVWFDMSINGRDWGRRSHVAQGTNRETNPCIAPGKNKKNLVLWEHDDNQGPYQDELIMNLFH